MKRALVKDRDQSIVRLPEGMRDELKAVAARNGRSMNDEVILRLSASGDLGAPPMDILTALQAIERRLAALEACS